MNSRKIGNLQSMTVQEDAWKRAVTIWRLWRTKRTLSKKKRKIKGTASHLPSKFQKYLLQPKKVCFLAAQISREVGQQVGIILILAWQNMKLVGRKHTIQEHSNRLMNSLVWILGIVHQKTIRIANSRLIYSPNWVNRKCLRLLCMLTPRHVKWLKTAD